MLIDNLDALPEMFKDGVRGIFLLLRNKDGEIGNAQRKSIKRISRGIEEWNEIIQDFHILQQGAYSRHRIYSSVNSRCMDKAMREFKRRQLDNDYATQDVKEWFYIDAQNSFMSCLMNPNCRNQSNFLVDCDSPEEYNKAIERIPAEHILCDYATKNGRHIISRPFNPEEIKVEVKKDDLIAIG